MSSIVFIFALMLASQAQVPEHHGRVRVHTPRADDSTKPTSAAEFRFQAQTPWSPSPASSTAPAMQPLRRLPGGRQGSQRTSSGTMTASMMTEG